MYYITSIGDCEDFRSKHVFFLQVGSGNVDYKSNGQKKTRLFSWKNG